MSDYRQMSHEQLYDMLMATDPHSVRATADLWKSQADKLQDFAADLMREANGLRHSWQGEAADQFFAAVERINQKVLNLARDAAGGSAAMTGAAEALEKALKRMEALGKPSTLEELAAKYAQEAGMAGMVLGGNNPLIAIAGTAVEKMARSHLEAERNEAVGIVAQLDAAYRDAANKLPIGSRDVYEAGGPSPSSTSQTGTGGRTRVSGPGTAGYGSGTGGYAGSPPGTVRPVAPARATAWTRGSRAVPATPALVGAARVAA